TSRCGPADVLEAFKIPINLSNDALQHSIETHHFGFCFAPLFHPAFSALRTVRKNIPTSTVLNLLGPLLNPTNAQHYVFGVAKKALLSQFAEILLQLNVKKSVIVHSQGMDEMSMAGTTEVAEINDGTIRYYTVTPQDFGLTPCEITELQGGNATEN